MGAASVSPQNFFSRIPEIVIRQMLRGHSPNSGNFGKRPRGLRTFHVPAFVVALDCADVSRVERQAFHQRNIAFFATIVKVFIADSASFAGRPEVRPKPYLPGT
jgi:hypothetical protein